MLEPLVHNTVLPSPFKGLVVDAARCWRATRDEGAPALQRLFALLDRYDCGILSPVFDGLMTVYEWALARPMSVGRDPVRSLDERRLIAMLDNPGRELGDGRLCTSSPLYCAIVSTRIMIGLTVATSTPNEARRDPAAHGFAGSEVANSS